VNTGSACIAHSGQASETQLVAAAKRGHQGAFGKFYARHSQKIYRTTLRITKNHENAEDAAQKSFLSALVHLGNFDGRSSFSTWLTRIAINSALMKLRKNRACPEISRDEPVAGLSAWDAGDERGPNQCGPACLLPRTAVISGIDTTWSGFPFLTRGPGRVVGTIATLD
jgi:hypothetical protein